MSFPGFAKSLTRNPKHFYIRVVPLSAPNDNGEWIYCGIYARRDRLSLRETSLNLSRFVPDNHVIVEISTRNTEK